MGKLKSIEEDEVFWQPFLENKYKNGIHLAGPKPTVDVKRVTFEV